ncbi:MAG: hypothetical protein MZW92_35520 [Comamonadaceae bacterium]|nr:hypothetical protein [Comamonadaceae bacterium]
MPMINSAPSVAGALVAGAVAVAGRRPAAEARPGGRGDRRHRRGDGASDIALERRGRAR